MMQSACTFNSCFLKAMLLGLKLGGVSSKKMTYRDRKRAIKLSASVAMAAASSGTNWSHALIARHVKHGKDRILVWRILGRKRYHKHQRMVRRRVHESARVRAKSLVKKRRRILGRLVPGGGECLDEFSLLCETIDYAISLQAQVNQMRLLTEALHVENIRCSSPTEGEGQEE